MKNQGSIVLKLVVVFSIAALAAISGAPAEAAVNLVQDGKSGYTIIVPAGASASESYAAEELQSYLEQISGARLDIAVEPDAPAAKCIYTGDTKGGAEIIGDPEIDALDEDGFIVRARGEDIAIQGAGPRGTLYGVYSLLEDNLGVRWLAPDETVIPEKTSITFDSLDYSQEPSFWYRVATFYKARDGDWAARNRLNGTQHRLEEKHGGKIEYIFGHTHSFARLVPQEKYMEEHPEYYARNTGLLLPDPQLCLTNPDVMEIATRKVLEVAAARAGKPGVITISQNDNVYPCMCERCRKAYENDGSVTDTYLRFVNRIADAVAEKYPNILIATLAYNYTEKAPVNTKPRPNVIIRLCHMTPSCDLHPLDKCPLNARFVQNLEDWAAVAPRIHIWHYSTVFHDYLAPWPNLNSLISDMDFYREHGVEGMLILGNGHSPGGDVAELKAWLLAKLMWNTKADAEALIAEFLRGYYGPAAPAMKKYIYVQRKQALRPNIHASLYAHPTAGYLDAELLKKMDAALSEAERLSEAEPVYADRVRRERLAYLYVQVAAPGLFDPDHFSFKNNGGKEALFERFLGELEHFGILRLHELETLDESIDRLRNHLLHDR